ncbi:MAG: alcohol dehydrogenase catalytic domain-containing protein [Planctomycetes bacterium]|nr:alcohol dehydrogenase catalytic domain-containing protein [Planctomycetota bacterium]
MAKRLMQLTRIGAFEIVELPIEKPGPGQVILRVEAVTTCPQWDMHLWRGEPMFPGMELKYPFTAGAPGHETVGRVTEVGPGVTQFKVGQRVAAWRSIDMVRHGTYGTHVLHDEDKLLAIPETDDYTAWAPLELAMCVATTVMSLRDRGFLPAKRAGVSGLGPGGLVAVQMLKALGVEDVVGFDTDAGRRKFAEQHGWCRALDPAANPDLARGGPNAMDVSIDCVGSAAVLGFLSDRTKHAVAIFGVLREDFVYKQRYWAGPGLTLMGYPGHHLEGGQFAHKLVTEKKLDLKPLSTHRVPLKNYDQAVQLLLKREAIKVCLLCGDGDV